MNVLWETYSVWLALQVLPLCLDLVSFPFFFCQLHCFCDVAALVFSSCLSFFQALGKPKPSFRRWGNPNPLSVSGFPNVFPGHGDQPHLHHLLHFTHQACFGFLVVVVDRAPGLSLSLLTRHTHTRACTFLMLLLLFFALPAAPDFVFVYLASFRWSSVSVRCFPGRCFRPRVFLSPCAFLRPYFGRLPAEAASFSVSLLFLFFPFFCDCGVARFDLRPARRLDQGTAWGIRCPAPRRSDSGGGASRRLRVDPLMSRHFAWR